MMEPGREGKKSFLDRLPKMGRISQLVLIIGAFLAIFITLLVINQNQTKTQTQLNSSLGNLQKIVTGTQTPTAKFESDLAQATADTEAAKAAFPSPQGSPQILDSLLQLADANDVSITSTQVATSGTSGGIGPILTVSLGLKGQIPKFQNFLLGLDSKLPTSKLTMVSFTVSTVTGEYDTGTVVIDIQCYGGS
jgi:hypothetical protein